jgi:hypothetical protein
MLSGRPKPKVAGFPVFNFKTGLREYKGDFLKLGKDDVLVIEGIHGVYWFHAPGAYDWFHNFIPRFLLFYLYSNKPQIHIGIIVSLI